jgi:hypothetical protein
MLLHVLPVAQLLVLLLLLVHLLLLLVRLLLLLCLLLLALACFCVVCDHQQLEGLGFEAGIFHILFQDHHPHEDTVHQSLLQPQGLWETAGARVQQKQVQGLSGKHAAESAQPR